MNSCDNCSFSGWAKDSELLKCHNSLSKNYKTKNKKRRDPLYYGKATTNGDDKPRKKKCKLRKFYKIILTKTSNLLKSTALFAVGLIKWLATLIKFNGIYFNTF